MYTFSETVVVDAAVGGAWNRPGNWIINKRPAHFNHILSG